MVVSTLMVTELLDLNETIAASIFEGLTYAWEILPRIRDYIIELGATLSESKYTKVADDIWISKTAIVAPTASITGPAIIGHNAEIRHCAFIRGSVIVGESAVIETQQRLKMSCFLIKCRFHISIMWVILYLDTKRIWVQVV